MGAGLGDCVTPACFSTSFRASISILVARRSAPVDLLTGCLATALGDLAALAVNGHDHRSLSASTSNAGKFFERGPRVLPDWPFLKSATRRRLAAAGLVSRLFSGHVAPTILLTQRGAGDTGARLPPRSSASYSRIVRNYQLAMLAMTSVNRRSRGFSGFPAGSLPSPRVLP